MQILNPSTLSKSGSNDIVIGDLGSRPVNESFYTLNIKGSGTEEGLRELVKKRIGNGTVVSETIRKLPNGQLEYEGRIRTVEGQ